MIEKIAEQIEECNDKIVFASPKSVAPYVYQLYKQGIPRKNTEQILKECVFDFDTKYIDTNGILDIIIEAVYSQKAYNGDEKTIMLYKKELDFILEYIDKMSETATVQKHKKNIINLLFAYLVYSRYDDFESGWINYNKKRIFDLAGISKLSDKVKNEISNTLVSNGVLSLRVVGIKNPILCYKLHWRVSNNEQDEIVDEFFIAPESTAKSFISQVELLLKKENIII